MDVKICQSYKYVIYCRVNQLNPDMNQYVSPEIEEVELDLLNVIAASNLENPEEGDIIEW